MHPLLLSMTRFATGSILGIFITRKHCIDIISSTTIHPTVFSCRLVTKYRFLADNSRQCPADSNRNSGGRNGATLEHVVEYGPLYHLLEPLHSSYWSVEGKTIDITLTNDKGGTNVIIIIIV